MRSLRLFVGSALVIFATACGGNYSSSPAPTPAPSPAPAPTPSGVPPAPGGSSSSVMIPAGASTLGNRAYTPDEVNVSVGTTVTWINTDNVAHTSSSDAREWDSGVVVPGGQFSVTLANAGTYQYHCAIHPGMVGTIVVR